MGYVWDNAGRLISTTAGGKTVGYQYDAAGNRIRTTWPETTPFYVTAAFDALNRPTAILEMGTTSLASYAYDDLSRRSTVTLGNGTATTYGYSTTQGALSSLAHNLAGTAQDQTYGYTRNQVRDIVQNSWNNDLYQWAGAVNGTKAYASNGLNQYTTVGANTLSYDGNGNLGGDGYWAYGYDLDNRLKTASSPGYSATLTYDAEGRLRQANLGGSITNLLYDGVALIGEYDASGNLLRRYVHGPGVDEPLVWYEGTGTTSKNWLYADHQGSIVGQANSSGTSTAIYSYGPYGEPNVTTGSRFRYTGQQYLSGLGLYYYKARFYSPMLGRFLQTDPIGYSDDMNLYAYVGGNPVNRSDPSGLSKKESVMLACGMSCSGVLAGVKDFGNGFAGNSRSVMEGPSTMHSLGAGARSAVDWGLVLFDVLNTPVSPGPDVGLIGAAGIMSRSGAVTGGNSVYRSVSAVGDVNYVGITNNLERRAAAHLNQKGIVIDVVPGLGNLSRTDARAVEQTLIEFHGLSSNGGTLMNRINSISIFNPAYSGALQRGGDLLRQVGYPGF